MFPYGIFLKPYVMVLMRSVSQRFRYLIPGQWHCMGEGRNAALLRKYITGVGFESVQPHLPSNSLSGLWCLPPASFLFHLSHLPLETMGQSQFFLLPVVLFMVLCYSDSKEANTPFMLISPRISTRNSSRVKNLGGSRQSHNPFRYPYFVLQT